MKLILKLLKPKFLIPIATVLSAALIFLGTPAPQNALGSVQVNNDTYVDPTTQNTIKGGVLRVIDSATGDIARTTSGWGENLEQLGWYFSRTSTAVSGEFDSAVTRTGRLTLKLSTTNELGRINASTNSTINPSTVSANFWNLIPIKPSTSYIFSCYVKTNNVAADAVFLEFVTFNSSYTSRTNYTTNKLTGTNDWTLLTISFTTANERAFGAINLRNTIAGNISDAWFDVNSMTLEEVSTITNPSSVPVKLYPTATAVTSNDNIDQSQTTVNGSTALGNATTNQKNSQSVTPTKKEYASFTFQKNANTGSPTSDIVISLETDNSNKPSGTVLISKTITAAQWDAISDLTDYNVLLPYVLTPGTKYWYVFTPSAVDGSNYRNLAQNSSGGYTGGDRAVWNGSAWTVTTADLYFKTLYSKNTTNFTVRTDTETLSYTSPTADGWANGTILDSKVLGLTPLTLQPGSNNIYYSSNGFTTASSTVDSSLQVIIQGEIDAPSLNLNTGVSTSTVNLNTLNQGLIFHYSMDREDLRSTTVMGNRAVDGTNGTISGATATTDRMGNTARAYDFDGNDNYIAEGTNRLPASAFQSGFTISAWINPESIGEGNFGTIVSKSFSFDGENGFDFTLASGNKLQFISNEFGSAYSANSSISLSNNNFVVMTATSDSLINFYVNGVLSGSANQENEPLSSITTTNPLTIGNRSGATDYTFNGKIDDVRIYNRVLTTDEISNLYHYYGK